MPAFRLRHFSDPQTLQGIAPSRLIRFLSPHREFFVSRGFELPAPDAPESSELDYTKLAAIFMTPDATTPDELVHALFLVDEMSFPEATENLLEAAEKNKLSIEDGDEHTAADIAIQVWLGDRTVLEQRHATQLAGSTFNRDS
jgi:hypothetical protein